MKIGVVGASGYAGGELLRLLSTHPEFEISAAMAASSAGTKITEIHPHLRFFADQKFTSVEIPLLNTLDLVFLALPHGESAKFVSQLTTPKIIDLGADFRLESAESWNQFYGGTHAGTWTYGLPEMPGQRAKIKNATHIANPGCYATAISAGLLPLIPFVTDSGLKEITIVAASGTTGAGRSLKNNLLASEVMGSLSAYKVGGVHQHTPEIEENIQRMTNKEIKLSFIPILAPMPRGILATISASVSADLSLEKLQNAFEIAYGNELFINVLKQGETLQTSSLTGSNGLQLQVFLDKRTNKAIIISGIDNLGKGAAGQAIQNANLVCGFAEGLGLTSVGIHA
jgi:N-acetyl-gamma-glutamyl-phosphate reductase